MIKTGTYNATGEKWCNNCQKYQPISDFGKNMVSNDGRSWSCAVSNREATNKIRLNYLKQTSPSAPVEKIDNTGDATDTAIKKLRLSHPSFKLANPYTYQRPDAYDNYMKITTGGRNHSKTYDMTQNIQRTEEYMKLHHSIESCKNAMQLKQLSESVIAYHKAKKQDSGELLTEYISMEDTLSVE